MKIYKSIFTIFILGLIILSCNKEDDRSEYPGNIIIHGDTFHLKLLGVEDDASVETKKKNRFYAYSGSDDDDLSAISNENWTYEMWIKVPHGAKIGDRVNPDDVVPVGACISSRVNGFELYLIEDDNADYAIKFGRLDMEDFQIDAMDSKDATENLFFDKWTHVAISRSSTDNNAKLYINGKLAASSTEPTWLIPSNDKWLQFNYFYRNGNFSNFFKGAMKNIRVSKIDRYPEEFTPNFDLRYNEIINDAGEVEDIGVDDDTLLQLDLEKDLTAFEEGHIYHPFYNKIKIKGNYSYYIKLHRDYFSWDTEIVEEYPVTGY